MFNTISFQGNANQNHIEIHFTPEDSEYNERQETNNWLECGEIGICCCYKWKWPGIRQFLKLLNRTTSISTIRYIFQEN